MPILDIEWVEGPADKLPEDLAPRLAQNCAQALGAKPGRTWVRLRSIQRSDYAEDQALPPDLAPVFVEVLFSRLPELEERAGIARKLAQSVGETMGRPSANVHVLFQVDAWERMAFGGELLWDE